MTEETSTTTYATEQIEGCGHTRVDHLVQRLDLIHELATAQGIVIPEEDTLRCNVMSAYAFVLDGQISETGLMAVTDIAVDLVNTAFGEDENPFLSFAESMINSAGAARARESAQG